MKNKKSYTEKTGLGRLVVLITWLTGILVSLAVGFGMINGVLPIKYIPDIITSTAGWIVVILTIVGAVLAIVDSF